MRVLVLGAGGQLGRELLRQPWPESLTPIGLDHTAVDITDGAALSRVIAEYRPALVVNAAAYTAVDKAESDRDTAYAVNRDGPRRLAEACRAAAVPLVHVSTDYVFDGTKATPYLEDDPVHPVSVYGASKEAGERAVREVLDRHVLVRTSWVVSPFGHNFVKTMLRLGGERDVLRVVDDQHGCPTAAADLARAVIRIAQAVLLEGNRAWGTYHFCNAGETTWCGLARLVMAEMARYTGRAARVEAITTGEYPTPVARPANSRLDCQRLEAAFGVVRRPWQEAVADVVAELFREERIP